MSQAGEVPSGGPAEVSFEISVAGLPSSHSAYGLAVEDLLELADGVAGLRVGERDVEAAGQKGGVTTFFAKLLTPGSENAIVQLFKAWLARDTRRSVTVTVDVPGVGARRVEVAGEHVSMDGLIEALRIAVPALAPAGDGEVPALAGAEGTVPALEPADGAAEQGMISQ